MSKANFIKGVMVVTCALAAIGGVGVMLLVIGAAIYSGHWVAYGPEAWSGPFARYLILTGSAACLLVFLPVAMWLDEK